MVNIIENIFINIQTLYEFTRWLIIILLYICILYYTKETLFKFYILIEL